MMKRKTLSTNFEQVFRHAITDVPTTKFWRKRQAINFCVVQSLCDVLNQHDPRAVSTLIDQIRTRIDEVLYELNNVRSKSILRSAEKTQKKMIQIEPSLAIVFTMDNSGYIREKAVKSVRSLSGAFELALLLYRLNDWVPEVRKAARIKILDLLDPETPTEEGLNLVLGCAEIILEFSRFGRASLEEKHVISTLLSYPGFYEGLWKIIIENKQDLAARLFRLSLENNKFKYKSVNVLQNAQHQSVRRMALKNLLAQDLETAVVNFDDALALGLKDTSIEVRRLALSYIIQEKPKLFHKEHIYRTMLKQKNSSLFDKIMFGLKSLGIDVLPQLRSNIKESSGEDLSASAILLARWGVQADGELLVERSLDCLPQEMTILLSSAAYLGNEEAKVMLRQVVLFHDDNKEALRAAIALAKMKENLNFQDFQVAIETEKDVVERGFLRLTFGIPTMEFANIMALMLSRNIECSSSSLWNILLKKRNNGMFQPTEYECCGLKEIVGSNLELANKFERCLGVKLKKVRKKTK